MNKESELLASIDEILKTATEITTDILNTFTTAVFPGDTLFELYATHGIPLDAAVYRIVVEKGLVVGWKEFIDRARLNKRWDFQTLELIEYALRDSCVPPWYTTGVLVACKNYVLENPHPGLRDHRHEQ